MSSGSDTETRPLPRPGTGAVRSMRRHATARTLLALILREMSTRYGRSPGGYIWAVVEPMAMILLLSVGFSLLLRSPSLGNSFILFYATGYLPFVLYMNVSNAVARAIPFSKPLLFYPGVTWLDAILARFVLNTLTGVMVAYILLAAILQLTDTRIVLDMVPILQAMALAALLALGIGTINAFLTLYFPIWEITWSIINRPLFLASAIFYIYEDLPPLAQDILWFNPLIHITGWMRTGFYPMYNAPYVSLVYVLAIALVTLAMGLMLLRRHSRTLLNL